MRMGAASRFSIEQLDRQIMRLKSKINFEGKATAIVYNFVKIRSIHPNNMLFCETSGINFSFGFSSLIILFGSCESTKRARATRIRCGCGAAGGAVIGGIIGNNVVTAIPPWGL